MYCMHCGAEIGEGVQYCLKCGKKAGTRPGQTTGKGGKPAEGEPKIRKTDFDKKRVLKWYLVFIVALLILPFGFIIGLLSAVPVAAFFLYLQVVSVYEITCPNCMQPTRIKSFKESSFFGPATKNPTAPCRHCKKVLQLDLETDSCRVI